MNIGFTVPGQPLPKQRARVMKGFSFTPKQTVQAEKRVALLARSAMKGNAPAKGRIRLELSFFRADRRRVDLDNLAKLVQDALNGICYEDDSQIDHLDAAKGVIDKANPRTTVRVEEMK